MNRAWRAPMRALCLGASLTLTCAVCSPALAVGPWSIESKDGKASIKFGYLVQARAESLDTADGQDRVRDLYFRRLRVLAGGKLNDKWSFFLETDSPNLGKGEPDGSKGDSDIYIQDFAITYTHSPELRVDFGMLLVPIGHNGTQSAITLMPVDYGPYSFLASGPTDSRVGRDYGVLVRGLVAEHFEYRAAVFQGVRGEDSTNDFRYSGRMAYHVFEPDAGLFYTGHTLGKKQILMFGASLDAQEEYRTVAFDAFWDQPVGDGNAFTVQANLISHDGDTFLPSFIEQDVLYLEAGYFFSRPKISIFAVFGDRNFDDPEVTDESRFQVGVGWYPAGYSRVLKVSYGRIEPEVGPERDRFVVQMQVFQF